MSVSESKVFFSPRTLEHPDEFVRRHIGPNAAKTVEMLKLRGFHSLYA